MCTTDNIQPCPSCGEKDDIHIILAPTYQQYSVMCWKCEYETRGFSNKDTAIQYWNNLKREKVVQND